MLDATVLPHQKEEMPMPIKRFGVTYITVSELAKRLDVHRNSVVYWINQGKIKAVRLGMAEKSPYYISEDEADRVVGKLAEGD